jgi:hypothetical protein
MSPSRSRLLGQAPLARLPAPAKQLVRIYPVGSRDACHRRAIDQRLFDNPLLRDAPPLPLDCTLRLTLRRDCFWHLPGSVHLCSQWTPFLSVFFARMALILMIVETVTTGRLRSCGNNSVGREALAISRGAASADREYWKCSPTRHAFQSRFQRGGSKPLPTEPERLSSEAMNVELGLAASRKRSRAVFLKVNPRSPMIVLLRCGQAAFRKSRLPPKS